MTELFVESSGLKPPTDNEQLLTHHTVSFHQISSGSRNSFALTNNSVEQNDLQNITHMVEFRKACYVLVPAFQVLNR